MKRFRNILYILDAGPEQEPQTTTIVQNLARRNDAAVQIVKLVEDTIIDNVGKQFSSRIQELIDLEQRHNNQELQNVLTAPGWQGIAARGEILTGKDFIAVIRKVLEDNHDLVIKARRHGKGTDQFAMRLFRKCPCPVWIIDSTGSQPFKTVIGAVDLAGDDEESRQLNTKIVELAYSLAHREQGEAHFVHAWHLEYEKTMRGPRFRISDEEIDAMKRELEASRTAAFTRLFDETGVAVDTDHIHLIEGSPGTTIKQLLHKLQADVLVMGTVARTGLPGLLIGNKAEEVLSQVGCTVLAVKPDGFLSPVTGT